MGLLVTDELGNTTKEGTFASGDVVTGANTVVKAVAQANVIAETIVSTASLTNKQIKERAI